MRLLAVIKERNMWLCILISNLHGPVDDSCVGVPAPLLRQHPTHALADMSLLMSVLGVSAALFGFHRAGISDKIGRKPVMIVSA